jgi:hypothetical protein
MQSSDTNKSFTAFKTKTLQVWFSKSMEAPPIKSFTPRKQNPSSLIQRLKTHTGSKPKGVGVEPTPNIPLLLLQTSNLLRGKKRATST